MALLFWRRLRPPPVAPGAAQFFRPGLDSLEGRVLPTGLVLGLTGGAAAALAAPGSAQATTGKAAARQVDISVSVNAPATVIDLSQVLSDWSGFRAGGTPQLSVTSNTNRDLVSASLSDTELTLTYTAGQTGSANVTVLAQDASGASIQVTFVITVTPA
ncbi:MAG TPA: hypothetical protein VFW33_08090, partial [Gemmataceae bacterium]|nr:hypothetical protein [Gemmataceae bacterium]